MPRDTFDFDIELLACCNVTGRFTAENGSVKAIELEDGTTFTAYGLGRLPTVDFRRAIAAEVLRQIEASEHYRSMTNQTAPIEDWSAYAPVVL